MKILWITNILFPEAEQKITGSGEIKSTGGWMIGAANALINSSEIKLFVACVSTKVTKLTQIKGERITYYIIPYGKGNLRYNSEYCSYWKHINDMLCPDIVHIHGTEYSHGLAYIMECGSDNVVISIQGLTSACCYYYCYGMTKFDIYRNITLRDLLRGSVIHGQKQFARRAKYEVEMLKMVKHVIGRTLWDRSHVWAINSDAKYYICNEILRPEFYDGSRWNFENSDKHSIFISQAGYPIKGLHQVLKAMPLILSHYPDTRIRVAGGDITKSSTLSDKLRLSGYGKYLKKMIKKLRLEGKVTFTGNLNGEQMKQEYLRANVFVCPSSIENSPNSLGEAQILGTPCVASYVGGAMDMMKGNENNLYRFEEIEMLAEKVCRVFFDEDKHVDMHVIAAERHSPILNGNKLLSIYKNINKC